MSTIQGIKKRVKSVKNISQITKAMQMVAASKMKKAQNQAERFKYYAEKIARAIEELTTNIDPNLHILLQKGNVSGKQLLLLVSTNKGLCGSLNNNLFKKINKWFPNFENQVFISIGRKGRNFIQRSNAALIADYSQESAQNIVSALAKFAVDGFINGEYKKIDIVFNRFVNSFTQKPEKLQLLPIKLQEVYEEEADSRQAADFSISFKVEPSERIVLDYLLPEYVENKIRDALYTAEASEHSARMITMKNAADNADNFVQDLTFEYNKLRQQEITMSIADMVTARMAVEE